MIEIRSSTLVNSKFKNLAVSMIGLNFECLRYFQILFKFTDFKIHSDFIIIDSILFITSEELFLSFSLFLSFIFLRLMSPHLDLFYHFIFAFLVKIPLKWILLEALIYQSLHFSYFCCFCLKLNYYLNFMMSSKKREFFF